MIENILNGFVLFASVYNFLFIFFGVALGVLVGALPGVGSSMTLAIVTPMTFTMQPESAIMFLFGIYVGAYYGGSITAILINTPGTASACATVLDGYPMARKGKAGKALVMALNASIVGHIFGVIMLIFLAPLIAKIALKFTPYEYFMIILFALTIIAAVAGKSFIKGLLATSLGLLIATIGIDPIAGVRRLALGILELDSGIALLPMLIGLFAVAEVFKQAERSIIGGISQKSLPQSKDPKDNILTFGELLAHKRTLIRSAGIGAFIGALPGIGGSTAGFLAYGRAKMASSTPEKYGEGELDGVCAAETANNAVVGASLIPLLTLGIPGSVSAAVLLNAFLIHGLLPGPMLLAEHGPEVYSLFFGLLFAAIALYLLGRLGIKMGKYLTKLSVSRLFPFVLVLCMVGSYAIHNSVFDLKIMLIFGVLGYLMQKYQMPLAPLVIAFILSPRLEISIRQSILLSRGNLSIMFTRPIVIIFLLLTILSVIGIIRQERKKKRGA